MKYRSQICIVGGGPAGLTASLFLSKWGIDHILVDKNPSYPRDKVCGENFDGRVGRLLNELSPRYLEEMTASGIIDRTWRYGLHVRNADLTVDFPRTNPPKLLSRRLDFDDFLYRQAQASPHVRLLRGEYVQAVETNADTAIVRSRRLEIEAQLVILANGAQGTLTRSARPPDMLFGRIYYQGILPRPEREIEVYFFQRPARGCMMICPLPKDQYNVEIGFAKRDYQKSGLGLEEILHGYIDADPDLRRRFAPALPLDKIKGASLSLPNRPAPCSGERWLLAGANVLSVNPMTGMGVGNAMVMGKLAAETARDCLDKNDFSHRAVFAYERAVRRKLRDVRKFNWIVNVVSRYIHLFEWILPWMLNSRLLRRILRRSDFVHRAFNPRAIWQDFFRNRPRPSEQIPEANG